MTPDSGIRVTGHAIGRARDRLGFSQETLYKIATRAFLEGREMPCPDGQKKEYGGMFFTFSGITLITCGTISKRVRRHTTKEMREWGLQRRNG